MKKRILYLVAFFLLPFAGQAIITANNTIAETNPFALTGFNWDYVYNYRGCSAVAVDPYWIITAAHVGGGSNLTINSTTYFQQETVYHPTADLALIRFDKALPGYYGRYSGSVYVGDDVLMVGYGNTGTVSATTFTDSGKGKGIKRWGSNEIDDMAWVNGVTLSYVATFTNGATLYEAGVGDKDSGGGSFINDNGTWKLVGVNFARGPSSPYTTDYMVAVPAYESWIAQTVPEPSTGVLLVGIGIVFGVIKRLRYMYQ